MQVPGLYTVVHREAGIADHVWKLDELIALLEAAEAIPMKRGRYAKTRERERADSD